MATTPETKLLPLDVVVTMFIANAAQGGAQAEVRFNLLRDILQQSEISARELTPIIKRLNAARGNIHTSHQITFFRLLSRLEKGLE